MKYEISVELLKENFEKLAQEIIVQAAKDYRDALRILKNDPENYEAKEDVRQVEKFFLGDFYAKLTTVPGEFLIKKLRKEMRV